MSKRKKKREDVNHKDGRKKENTKKKQNLFTNNMTNHNDKYIRTLQTTMQKRKVKHCAASIDTRL